MTTTRTPLTSRFAALVGGLGLAIGLSAAEPPSLDPQLEPLRPWLGKTWKGVFPGSSGGAPLADIARWERALNGKAVRILHSLNEGMYGGESIVRWDPQQQAVVYHYFTTAGFTTTGKMSFKDGRLLTHETVHGDAGGVTEVRGAFQMLPDATFRVKTEHLKDGQWSPAREVIYREDPTATVVFK